MRRLEIISQSETKSPQSRKQGREREKEKLMPTIVYHKSYFFCEVKPHAKFQNPTITPSGRKVTSGEEREREKNAINSGHFVPQQCPRAAHALRSGQNKWV